MNQPTIKRHLKRLDELHYTMRFTEYEAALHAAIKQLRQVFPDFTIAFADGQ